MHRALRRVVPGLLTIVMRVVVRVGVAGDLGLQVVEDDAPDLGAGALEMRLRALEDEASDLARLVDEQHAVHLARHDGGIGHRQDRRRIDQDDVVLRADGVDEVAHGRRRQQLGGIRRNRTRLDDVQVVEAGRRHDVFHLEPAHQDVGDAADAVAPLHVADQDVRETRLARDAEEAVDRRAPHVGADQERLLATLGHREREVDDGGRLAFLQRRARHHQHLAATLHALELDVRAQRAVRLGHRRLRVEMRDEQGVALQRLGIHLGERGPPLEEAFHCLARIDVGHDTEHLDVQIGLDVLDGADGGVERLLHEGEYEAEHETEQGADHHRVQGVAADGLAGIGGGSHEGHFFDALRLLDQRLLVLGLEQRQEVVVDLGVALQPLQAELDGGNLAVLLHEVRHLAGEDVLAILQGRDLRAELAPHLESHLAETLVDGLQPRMLVGRLERELRALHRELGLRRLQALQRRVRRLHVDPLRHAAGVGAGQPRLDLLELRSLLTRLFDIGANLCEERQQHGGFGTRRDHAIGVAEGPDLLLRPLDARVDLLELRLDELARLREPRIAILLVVVAIDLGHRVGEVARLARIGRGRRDLEDARVGNAIGLDLGGERVERVLVRTRLADGAITGRLWQPAHPPRDLFEHGIALDERGLRLDVVGRRVRQHLHQQPRHIGRLLELHGGRRLVDRHALTREPEADQHGHDGGGDDPRPPAADDEPVVAQVHLVLRHDLGSHRRSSLTGPVM